MVFLLKVTPLILGVVAFVILSNDGVYAAKPTSNDPPEKIAEWVCSYTMGTINAESCAIILTSPSIPNLLLSLPFYAEQKRNSKHDEKGTIFIKGESAFFVFSSIMPAEYIYAGNQRFQLLQAFKIF